MNKTKSNKKDRIEALSNKRTKFLKGASQSEKSFLGNFKLFLFIFILFLFSLSLISAETLTTTSFTKDNFKVDLYADKDTQLTSSDITWESSGQEFYPVYKDAKKQGDLTSKGLTTISFKVSQLEELVGCEETQFGTRCQKKVLDFSKFEAKNKITSKTIEAIYSDGKYTWLLSLWTSIKEFFGVETKATLQGYMITYIGEIKDLDPALVDTFTSGVYGYVNNTEVNKGIRIVMNSTGYNGTFGTFDSFVFAYPRNRTRGINLSFSSSTGTWNTKDLCDADSSCVAYWALDSNISSGIAQNFTDSKSSNTGSCSNSSKNCPTLSTGISSPAMKFDGVNDFINISSSPYINFSGDNTFTISTWVNPVASPTGWIVSRSNPTSYNYGLELTSARSPLFVLWTSAGTVHCLSDPTYPLTTNSWTHLVAVANSTSCMLYANNILIDSDLRNYSRNMTAGNYQTWIGKRTDLANGYHNGSIDELIIYNKSLSSVEITNLYKAGLSQHAVTNITLQTRTANTYNNSDPSLVAFYPFNIDTGLNDSKGINNGTCSGTSCPISNASGVVGDTYNFDGFNDKVNVTLSFTSVGYNSSSLWIKPSSTGIWQHIAYNGTNYFLNGVVGTVAIYPLNRSGNIHNIGLNVSGNIFFNGSIDEVRIYNRSLSATEVLDLYNLGATHISDWSAWSSETPISSDVNNIDSAGKFMQYRTTLRSNDTTGSPYLLGYNVTLINNAPVITSVKLNSSNNLNDTTGDLLRTITATDGDGDAINSYSCEWFKTNTTGEYNILTSTNTLPLGVLSKGNLTLNDNWKVQCRVYDGDYWSNYTNSTSILIRDYTNSTINTLTVSPANNTQYNSATNYIFTANITNTKVPINTIIFQFNTTNYTVATATKTLTGISAGNYPYCWWANTTEGSQTVSCSNYVIVKNTTALALAITPAQIVIYPNTTTATGTLCPDQLTCNLYEQGILKANPYTLLNGVGSYIYVYNNSGNANYTAQTISKQLNVTNGTGSCDVLFSRASPLTYPDNLFYAYSNCNTPFILTREGTVIGNNSLQNLAYGNYTFNVTRTDGNYTNLTDSEVFEIRKGSVLCSISGTNVTYPNSLFITGNCLNSEDGDKLYLNDIEVTNPYLNRLGVGTYTFKVNTTSQNYTTSYSQVFEVYKGTCEVYAYIGDLYGGYSRASRTVPINSTLSLKGTKHTGIDDLVVELFNGTTSLGSDTNEYIISKFFDATAVIKAQISATQNYTACSESWTVTTTGIVLPPINTNTSTSTFIEGYVSSGDETPFVQLFKGASFKSSGDYRVREQVSISLPVYNRDLSYCSSCSCALTMNYPNGSIHTMSGSMINNMGILSYDISFDTLGQYSAKVICTDGVYNGFSTWKFNVSSSILLWVILIGLAGFFLIMSTMGNTEFFLFISGGLFVLSGVFSMIYGIKDFQEIYTRAISFVSIGLGLLLIVGAYLDFGDFGGNKQEDED